MAKKNEIKMQEEAGKLAKIQFRSVTVSELQSSLDNVMLEAVSKMREIIHNEEITVREINGKPVLQFTAPRDKVAAFNAIINAGKYLELRKTNEKEDHSFEWDLSGMELIHGEAHQNHGLYPALPETEGSLILDR